MFSSSFWQTYASYGVTGEKARYCAKHKGLNMVNLTVKHCEFSGCVTQPSFNYAGQRKARSVYAQFFSCRIERFDASIYRTVNFWYQVYRVVLNAFCPSPPVIPVFSWWYWTNSSDVYMIPCRVSDVEIVYTWYIYLHRFGFWFIGIVSNSIPVSISCLARLRYRCLRWLDSDVDIVSNSIPILISCLNSIPISVSCLDSIPISISCLTRFRYRYLVWLGSDIDIVSQRYSDSGIVSGLVPKWASITIINNAVFSPMLKR